VRTRMLASPETIKKEYPARLEKAKQAGNDAMAKFLQEQIEWASKGKVEETIQIWHLPPAHTDGDSVVFFEKAKVLHMGDDFFNKVIPFIDVSGGGSARGSLRALSTVIRTS